MAKRYVFERWSGGTATAQGTVSQGYLYAASAGSYSTGYQSTGDYAGQWITYVGSDSIEPSVALFKGVSGYKSTAAAGVTNPTVTDLSGYVYTLPINGSSGSISSYVLSITIKITPATTTYGGDIVYTVERQINEQDWVTLATNTTETGISATVGMNVAYYNVRVTASCYNPDGEEIAFTGDTVESGQESVNGEVGTRKCWNHYDVDNGNLTFTGVVTSDSLDAYPLDKPPEDGDTDYYEFLGGDTPEVTWVINTGTAKGGEAVTMMAYKRSSYFIYGDIMYYRYQTSMDGGESWVTVAETSDTTVTITLPYADSFTSRVQAFDNVGYTGEWVTSYTATIELDVAPTVTIDTVLGTVSEAFSVPYTVTDDDSEEVTVSVLLDGTEVHTDTGSGTYTISETAFQQLLNGDHTITVTATDDAGESGSASLSFTKSVTACSITWETAKATASPVKSVYITYAGSFSEGDVTMLVTNDSGATWEDATVAFLQGNTYTFSNSTAVSPGFNFKLSAYEKESADGGYFSGLGFILGTGESSEYGNTVATLTHVKAWTEHSITGLSGRNGLVQCLFRAAGSFADGDSVTVDDEAFTVNTVTGGAASWADGACVSCVADCDNATLTLQI